MFNIHASLNLTLVSQIIKQYQTTYQTIKTNYSTAIGKSPCKAGCAANAIQVKDCTCKLKDWYICS